LKNLLLPLFDQCGRISPQLPPFNRSYYELEDHQITQKTPTVCGCKKFISALKGNRRIFMRLTSHTLALYLLMVSFNIALPYVPNGDSINVHYMTKLRGGQPMKGDRIPCKIHAVFCLPDDQVDF
jgi:hypothetical protein